MQDDADRGEILFRNFLKWQIPNPDSRDYKESDGCNIKPFVGTLHLIEEVNQKESMHGREPKGLSREEFCLFVPTLLDHSDINRQADKTISLRQALSGRPQDEQRGIFEAYRKSYAEEFISSSNAESISKLLKNLDDYGDNIIRYFRLTRYIRYHGWHYVDLEPRRHVEIRALLDSDSGEPRQFRSKSDYLAYISDQSEPTLPWETKQSLVEIAKNVLREVRGYESQLSISEGVSEEEYAAMDESDLISHIAELRNRRQEMQTELNHQESQEVDKIHEYIDKLEHIYESDKRPILLEHLSALSMHAMNDAIKVQPNYPVGDDNEPTFTAPANTPDIECFYESFNMICEVTMLTNRSQWYNEGQPVMRHLRDFEERHNDKPSYCVFIAPQVHRDTLNTFWNSVMYGYEGEKQRIVPLTINQLASILKTLIQIKGEDKILKYSDIYRLYSAIVDLSGEVSGSEEWLRAIPEVIVKWQESLISGR